MEDKKIKSILLVGLVVVVNLLPWTAAQAVETIITTTDTTMAEITGSASGDAAGYSVSSAGDVNADGYDDILIGAELNNDGGADAGSVYLVYGSEDGITSESVDVMVEFIGEEPGDDAGISVSGAGDLNGDGYDDLVIGASGNDDGGVDSGSVYIVYGQADDLTSIDLSTTVELTGEAAGDAAGTSVAAAGDVNADGYDDLLIGAPLNDDGGADAGAVYLVYGQSTELVSDSLSTAVELIGESAGDAAGIAVDTAGDLNADGYDDILIGADTTDTGGVDAGSVYVIYGQTDELVSSSVDEFAELIGDAAGDDAGDAVAGVGDLNDDGYDDIAIGANLNDDGGVDAGAVYIMYGEVNELTSGELTDAIELIGETAGDDAGRAVAAAGDVNDDGFADLLIGADGNDDNGEDAGSVYVVYGQSEEVPSGDLNTDIELEGDAVEELAGESVSSADVNGDGVEEIIVGEPGNGDAGDEAGAVYIIYPIDLPIAVDAVTKDGHQLHLAYSNGATQTLRPFNNNHNFHHALSTDSRRLIVSNARQIKVYESGELLAHARIGRKKALSRGHHSISAQQFHTTSAHDTIAYVTARKIRARVGIIRLTHHNTLVKKRSQLITVEQALPVTLTPATSQHRFTTTFGSLDEQTSAVWKILRSGKLKRL